MSRCSAPRAFAAGVAKPRRQQAQRASADRLVATLHELKALHDTGALSDEARGR
jgi:hypothetical protein